MQEDSNKGDHLVDAFVDGLLEGDDLGDATRLMAEDKQFRAEVRHHEAINDSIRALYSPIPTVTVASLDDQRRLAAPAAVTPHLHDSASWRKPWAIAAVLLLSTAAGWQVWPTLFPPTIDDAYKPQAWRSLETVFADEVNNDLVPAWVCKDDQEFARTFRKRLGQALVVGALPDGLRGIGLSYCNSITAKTIYYLARSGEEPVLVFVDRVARDTRPTLNAQSALHLHRRELGKLVLYELSAMPQPTVLPHFYLPD